MPLSYSLYRNNINENITNKAVKELINQKPFSYLCSTNFMKMSERKIIHIDMDAFYASVEQRDNGSPDKPGGLSIQLCKSEKKEFYIRYSS